MTITFHEMAEWRKRLRIGDYATLHSGEYSIVTNIFHRGGDVVFSVCYLSKKHGEPRELNCVSIWHFDRPMKPHEIAAAKLQGLV